MILALLSLAALGLLACERDVDTTGFTEPLYNVKVGETKTLLIVHEKGRSSGCRLGGAQPTETVVNGSVEAWTITPADGATIEGSGAFTASAPGSYAVKARMKSEGPAYATIVKVSGSSAKMLYDNHNDGVVKNGGNPATFELEAATTIATIENYHYAEGKGTSGGGTIGLKAEDGTIYGPWDTETRDGQGGVPNAYWTATANVVLPPGMYTIIDSDPRTWSQNAGSRGFGMTRIAGAPAE